MCSHYQSVKNPQQFADHFGVDLPEGGKWDLWPGYTGPFIRLPDPNELGNVLMQPREALLGSFGLIPHWADDTKIARNTYNARSESVASKPSFRDAWRRAQHCIIPAQAIFEPDWSGGKAVPARIEHVEGKPLGIAGIWAEWKSAEGQIIYSFSMLTINADDHALMRQFHKPTDEKRMVVILPENRYQEWLGADAAHSMPFMQQYPAENLLASGPSVRES